MSAEMVQSDSPEVVRRQAEWERQIESLDMKEMELHQTQLRLVREQTMTFIRDLSAIRQEVAALKARHEVAQVDMAASGDMRLKELQELIDRERRDREAACGVLLGKVLVVESGIAQSKELKSALERQTEERAAMERQLEHRLAVLGDGFGRHMQDIERKLASHRAIVEQEREANHKELRDLFAIHSEDLLKVQVALQQERSARDLQQIAANERVERLERELQARLAHQLGAWEEVRQMVSSERIAREAQHEAVQESLRRLTEDARALEDLGTLRITLEQACTRLVATESLTNELRKSCSGISSMRAHYTSLEERTEYLESIIGDSNQQKDWQSALTRVQRLHERVAACEQGSTGLSSRLDHVETFKVALDGAEQRRAQDLASLHARLDLVQGRLDEEREAREGHRAKLEELAQSHAAVVGDAASLGQSHASVAERLTALELAGTKQAKELEALGMAQAQYSAALNERLAVLMSELTEQHATAKAHLDDLHARLSEESLVRQVHHGTLHERLAGELQARDENHSALQERLQMLEVLLGEHSERHQAELAAHREAHATELAAHREVGLTQHVTLAERLQSLEQALGDHSELHGRSLLSAREQLEQLLHGHLTEERSVRESHHGMMVEQLAALERALVDHADRHQSELSSAREQLEQLLHGHLAGERATREAHHGTLAEQLASLEQALGQHADRHGRELGSTKEQLERLLHGQLSEERAAREVHHSSVRELLGKEREIRDMHHSSLTQQLQQLELLIGSHSERHGRELEAHRSAHSKLAGEIKAREAIQSSTEERVDFLERALADAVDKHSKALDAASLRIGTMNDRMGHVEKQCQQLPELQKGLAALSSQKTTLETQHSALKDRVDFMEGALGESADSHAKALEAIRASYSKLSGEAKARDLQHTALTERIIHVERVMGESSERVSEDLAAASARLDDLHERMAACEAYGPQLETLKKASAVHASDRAARDARDASVAERLDYLEKALVDSADAHAQDLALAHGKIEQAQARITEERVARESLRSSVMDQLTRERQAREDQDTSLDERLTQLSKTLGDAVEKQSRELQAAHSHLHGKLGLLEKRLTDELADVRQSIAGDKQLRAQNHEAVMDQIESERRAREVFERTVQGHIAGERKSREGSERVVQEQFVTERAARDRLHEHVQDMVTREREARQKLQDNVQEALQREAMSREVALKGLHEGLAKERAIREQQQAVLQDSLQREQSTRCKLEALVSQEQADREKFQDGLTERVDSLQRSVNIFDSLLRREAEDRAKETKRLWDAIDNHTHDLSTQILEVDASGRELASDPLQAELLPERVAVAPPRVLRTTVGVPMGSGSPAYGWPTPAAGATLVEPLAAGYPATSAATTVVAPLRPLAQQQPGTVMLRPTLPVATITGATTTSYSGSSPIPTSQVRVTSPTRADGQARTQEQQHMEKISIGHTIYNAERLPVAEIRVD